LYIQTESQSKFKAIVQVSRKQHESTNNRFLEPIRELRSDEKGKEIENGERSKKKSLLGCSFKPTIGSKSSKIAKNRLY